ncbi:MAG: ABC transporter ATP-binding protein [Lachnospiraceae bacterium]
MYLELKDICKSFGQHTVVNHLNISVQKGEILCLLGASGCGKTTTLKMIGGFLKADSGSICLDGQEITGMPPENRPVATVFQSYALFPHMTVLKNVMYGLKFQNYSKKEARKTAMDYLDIVGLNDYAGAGVQEISGGQRQRVALARALVTKPKVLLLDEPLSNLDAKLRIKMREEIKEIQKRFHITTIFVTHDQEEAMAIANRIAIMHGGKLIQTGKPEEVYRQPTDEYVMDFLGTVNTFIDPAGKKMRCRPEDMEFVSEGGIRGKVIRSEFLGFYRQYYIQIGDDQIIMRGGQQEEYWPGDIVNIKV